MADITALLQQLGFSEYEARAYLALLQRNPLNGYELAKVSGIPRANVYAVLQKLDERGASTSIRRAGRGTRQLPRPSSPSGSRAASRMSWARRSRRQRIWRRRPTPNMSGISRGTRP